MIPILDLITYDDEYLGVAPFLRDGKQYLVIQHRDEGDGGDHLMITVYRWEGDDWNSWTVYDETGEFDDLFPDWEAMRHRACEDPESAMMEAML